MSSPALLELLRARRRRALPKGWPFIGEPRMTPFSGRLVNRAFHEAPEAAGIEGVALIVIQSPHARCGGLGGGYRDEILPSSNVTTRSNSSRLRVSWVTTTMAAPRSSAMRRKSEITCRPR